MHASNSLLAAAVLLLPAVSAVPGGTRIARPRAEPTDLWITIDKSGQPKTVTPVLTTISGTPTVISGAPNEITGTVFTQTNDGQVTTSTGDAPIATATAADGAGSFPICNNKDGVNAPFCAPKAATTLNPGKTYYVTWDPTFFNSTNATVVVTGSYFNASTGSILTQAFSSSKLAAAWSFYAWTIDSGIMQGKSGVNISLTIAALSPGSAQMTPFQGPIVTVADPPPYRQEPAKLPTGAALYIGLPTVFGFIVLVVCGTCIWNRKTRKIALGNIMSRSRHGYGIGKSRTTRQRRERKEAIRLMEREVAAPEHRYRDNVPAAGHNAGWEEQVPGRDFDAGLPRRDSDALGSLAGTPTEERHMDFHRPRVNGSGNAFRDEMRRQDRDRL